MLKDCDHRYITATHGRGWHCANRECGVGILSLSCPIPMPLIERALEKLVGPVEPKPED